MLTSFMDYFVLFHQGHFVFVSENRFLVLFLKNLSYIDIEAELRKTLPYDLNINNVMAILNLKCRVFQP